MLIILNFIKLCYTMLYFGKGDNMSEYVKASHILVKTEEEALKIKEEIINGKDFSQAAKESSLCPSGQNGGDLGYFSKGQMVKEFENVAFSMNKGEISNPVKTQFGYHLIYVTDKQN